MDFILIVKSKGEEPSAQDLQQLLNNYIPWMEKYAASGNYLGGSPFHKQGALVLAKGEHLLEGEFLSGTNLFTGYIHLKADTLNRAIVIAEECPLLAHNSIVVMPILEMN